MIDYSKDIGTVGTDKNKAYAQRIHSLEAQLATAQDLLREAEEIIRYILKGTESAEDLIRKIHKAEQWMEKAKGEA
jgi:hypothetical protein